MAPSNDTTVVLRIPQELKESLQEQAEHLDVSLSEVIRMKLMIADSAVHREPVIRLGDRQYRLWDVLRHDVLEFDLVESGDGRLVAPSLLVDEPGIHENRLTGRYTDAVRDALATAREEAIRLGSTEIAPVHIALGMVATKGSNAARIVAHLAGDVAKLVRALETEGRASGSVRRARSDRAQSTKSLALTKHSEKIMKLIYLEAKLHGRDIADSAILLAAFLREAEFSGAVLGRFGITYDAVRELIERFAN